ncbi:hypothetical protein GCM10020000_06300 [Streptomyces olivoverticillatus]
MERWPSRWNFNGTYGTVEPVCVDALSLLSQVKLSDALTEEINNHSPPGSYTRSRTRRDPSMRPTRPATIRPHP